MENDRIRILHLEDSQTDVDLVNRMLKRGNLLFDIQVVDSGEDFIKGLHDFKPDVVISDHSLPAFNSLKALHILKTTGPHIPFILVTGTVSEEFAAQVIREGADDYILKDRLERLPQAVLNALEKYQLTREKQKSENHLRNFFEHSIDVLCTIDIHGIFIDVSAASELMWGYKPEELIGKKCSAFVLKEDLVPTFKVGAEIITGIKKTNFENRHIHKNGSIVPMVWSACWDDNAKVMYCVARNGTEKKLAEEKLKTSEANLTAIIENTGGMVYSLDKEFRYIAFNGAIKNTMKEFYDIDIKPGDKIFEFLEKIDPMEAREWERIYTEALSGKALQFVKDYSEVDKPYYLSFSVNPIWKNGEVAGLSCLARDVTENRVAANKLKASEQRYRHVTQNAILGVYWLSEKGTMLNANEAFCNMLGYTNLEVIDRHYSEFTFNGDMKIREEVLKQLFSGEVESYRSEKRYRTRSGEIIWGELIQNAIKNEDGKVKYIIGVVQDITARKKVESEIAALNESLEIKIKERTAELQQANRDLESFSYTVSHDLQAPLRVVSGFSKIMMREYSNKLDENGREQLKVIDKMICRMSQLVKDLLEFSRGGKAMIVKSEVNMNELVHVAVEEVKMTCLNPACNFKINDMPPAFCDARLLKQVWVNLVQNAVKYSKNNSAAIVEIGTACINGTATYYVKDNGTGFDMKHADRLFGAFQRLHKQEEFEGTGVGLATVYRIIAGHGGRIWAEAKVNEGATFYFTLPCKESSDQFRSATA